MTRALPEHCCLLKITANRSRLVRRDLREIKGEFKRVKKGVPEKARPEENLRGQRRSRAPVGLSSNHGNFFHQLERNFVK